MKKAKMFAAAIIGSAVLCSCGGMSSLQQSGTGSSTSSMVQSGISVLSSVLGGLMSSTTSTTIIGSWTYQSPAIQFESENLLAKAGGTLVSQPVVNKLDPYFQKAGLVPGKFTITFNNGNSCTYIVNGKQYSGTYQFDASAGTIQIQGSLMSLPTSYISVSGNQMTMTFDASKILSLIQGVGASSSNSTISSISSIINSYSGMKAGFTFTK